VQVSTSAPAKPQPASRKHTVESDDDANAPSTTHVHAAKRSKFADILDDDTAPLRTPPRTSASRGRGSRGRVAGGSGRGRQSASVTTPRTDAQVAQADDEAAASEQARLRELARKVFTIDDSDDEGDAGVRGSGGSAAGSVEVAEAQRRSAGAPRLGRLAVRLASLADRSAGNCGFSGSRA
jgi:hypothetical protein